MKPRYQKCDSTRLKQKLKTELLLLLLEFWQNNSEIIP